MAPPSGSKRVVMALIKPVHQNKHFYFPVQNYLIQKIGMTMDDIQDIYLLVYIRRKQSYD